MQNCRILASLKDFNADFEESDNFRINNIKYANNMKLGFVFIAKEWLETVMDYYEKKKLLVNVVPVL